MYRAANAYAGPRYHRYWLSGPNAALFQPMIVDDDGQPSTDNDDVMATTRPLPAGTYRLHRNWQHYEDMPCNFVRDDAYRDWTVTVAASTGTVHEAFFDPAALGRRGGRAGRRAGRAGTGGRRRG